jgi:hypothetical protein
VAVVALLSACSENPAEVRNDAISFPLRANWSSTAAPVGNSGVSATLAVKQFDGFRNEVSISLTGTSGRSYQWRIFRGDCATTVAAANVNDPNGLLVFATVQSYPDITLSGGTTASLTREVAGSLDSLRAYSIRVRLSQSATNWNGTNPIACGDMQRSPA